MDFTTWMPPDLSPEEKAHWAEQYPDDPHAAAAAAWESYAATLPATAGVDSVSTGAQSVKYARASSPAADAAARAAMHRARSKVGSVPVAPVVRYAYPLGLDAEPAVIVTYESPPMPPTLPTEVNLPPTPVAAENLGSG